MIPCKEFLIAYLPENEELLDEIVELIDGESEDFLLKVRDYMLSIMLEESNK